jgi:quercetin dioxygenase-like cupin family protein
MKITRRDEGVVATKPDGTRITYYLFPEYEFHYNELDPGISQSWHHHNIIEEILYVLSGTVEVRWVKHGRTFSSLLSPGDIAAMGRVTHSVSNPSDQKATFLITKLVFQGLDQRQLFREDKYGDPSS